jgi:arylformamidase
MNPVSASIAAIGTGMGPDVLEACRKLFDEEQLARMERQAVWRADCVYGPHPRHRLDLYGSERGEGTQTIALFVPGGGFRVGDKGGPSDGDGSSWQNAAVARTMAEAGFIGAVMNYRLLPEAQWPDGGHDVLAALDWLRDHGPGAQGDHPPKIVLIGTSAGSVNIANALQLRPDMAADGMILLSGRYGYTPRDKRDEVYFGPLEEYEKYLPRPALVETPIPLMLACAEFDPPLFQADFLGLLQERLARHGTMPRAVIMSDHNHYSMAMHIGTSDTRLSDEIIDFIGSL